MRTSSQRFQTQSSVVSGNKNESLHCQAQASRSSGGAGALVQVHEHPCIADTVQVNIWIRHEALLSCRSMRCAKCVQASVQGGLNAVSKMCRDADACGSLWVLHAFCQADDQRVMLLLPHALRAPHLRAHGCAGSWPLARLRGLLSVKDECALLHTSSAAGWDSAEAAMGLNRFAARLQGWQGHSTSRCRP